MHRGSNLSIISGHLAIGSIRYVSGVPCEDGAGLTEVALRRGLPSIKIRWTTCGGMPSSCDASTAAVKPNAKETFTAKST